MTPAGINHLVDPDVRNMEESHKFWTEILGFKQVGRSSRRPMRFYSGDHSGQMNHHDIALCENPNLPKPPENWAMFDMPLAINHIAITMPNREAWLKQLTWLRQNGVKFHRRVNHGMTHSLYISTTPNGYGVGVLYCELPQRGVGRQISRARSTSPRTGADRRRGSLRRRHAIPAFRHGQRSCRQVTLRTRAAASPEFGRLRP